jgi:hypothetical protein
MHGLRTVQTQVEYSLNFRPLVVGFQLSILHHIWQQRDPSRGEFKLARYRSLVTGATRVFSPNDCQVDQAQNWQDNFSFQLQLCYRVNHG